MTPRRLFLSLLLGALALIVAPLASAQVFFSNLRVGSVVSYHTTVGTSTAAAIPSGSVSSNLLGWKICNDAVNSSTYLLVGKAADVGTDGTSLAPGACFVCPNCTGSTLKAANVKGQASSNGYSVLQYKQQ